jgi:hypothetical protein
MSTKLSTKQRTLVENGLRTNPILSTDAPEDPQIRDARSRLAIFAAETARLHKAEAGDQIIDSSSLVRERTTMLLALEDTDIQVAVPLGHATRDSHYKKLENDGLILDDHLLIRGIHVSKGEIVGLPGFVMGARTAGVYASTAGQWAEITGGLQNMLVEMGAHTNDFSHEGYGGTDVLKYQTAVLSGTITTVSGWLSTSNQDAISAGFQNTSSTPLAPLSARVLRKLPTQQFQDGATIPLKAGTGYHIERGRVCVNMNGHPIAKVPSQHMLGERMLTLPEGRETVAPYQLAAGNNTKLRVIQLSKLKPGDRIAVLDHAARNTARRTFNMNCTAAGALMKQGPEQVRKFLEERDTRAKENGGSVASWLSTIFDQLRAA